MRSANGLKASLILVLACLSAVGLFLYWDQIRNETLVRLQTRLNHIEVQRLEEDKGVQVLEAARKVASELDHWCTQMRDAVERSADRPEFRSSHLKPLDRRKKIDAFLQWAKSQTRWEGCLLTDETGQLLSSTGILSGAVATVAFLESSRQHATVLHLTQHANRLYLQLTSPCLANPGQFLGVLQTEAPVPTELLQTLQASKDTQLFIATLQGHRFTPAKKEGFPENLGALIGLNLQEMEKQMMSTPEGFYPAKWGNSRFLLGSVPTVIPSIKLYGLLETSQLEKIVEPLPASLSFASDPLLLAGLGLIVLLGGGLLWWLVGKSPRPLKQLEEQLSARLEGELTTLETPRDASWEGLFHAINQVIERAQAGGPAGGRAEGVSSEPTSELATLKEEQQRLHRENDELHTRLETLSHQLQSASGGQGPDPELTARLRSDSRLRADAITSMSEDLKDTLTVIKNYISSILASGEGQITDSQQEFLGVVINKSARLERQINDLVDVAQLEGKREPIMLTAKDLGGLLDEIILNLQPQLETRQLQLIREFEPGMASVMMDSGRLGQVFATLLQYAIRITPVGSEVRVSAAETLSDVVIKIRDGGNALSSEQAEQVFTAFHGLDSPAGPDLSGSGLRFALVRRVIEAHHGTVTLRGMGERGNQVVVSLPKVMSEEPEGGSPLVGRPHPEALAAEAAAIASAGEADHSHDLSAFMGRAAENEPNQALPKGKDQEQLDDLLRDIETMNRGD